MKEMVVAIISIFFLVLVDFFCVKQFIRMVVKGKCNAPSGWSHSFVDHSGVLGRVWAIFYLILAILLLAGAVNFLGLFLLGNPLIGKGYV